MNKVRSWWQIYFCHSPRAERGTRATNCKYSPFRTCHDRYNYKTQRCRELERMSTQNMQLTLQTNGLPLSETYSKLDYVSVLNADGPRSPELSRPPARFACRGHPRDIYKVIYKVHKKAVGFFAARWAGTLKLEDREVRKIRERRSARGERAEARQRSRPHCKNRTIRPQLIRGKGRKNRIKPDKWKETWPTKE